MQGDCPTPGCTGIGHVKGAKYTGHHRYKFLSAPLYVNICSDLMCEMVGCHLSLHLLSAQKLFVSVRPTVCVQNVRDGTIPSVFLSCTD